MSTYSVIDAKNNLSRLIDASRSGDRVIITKRGVPSVEIVPVHSTPSQLTGSELAAWLADHPTPARLTRDTAELEHQIAETRESWE